MGEQQTRVLVTGAGGFIGHHLTTYLKNRGYWVRGVDLKHPEYGGTEADEFEILDLRRWETDACSHAGKCTRCTIWPPIWGVSASSSTTRP